MSFEQDMDRLFSLKFWRLSKKEDLPFGLTSEPITDSDDWLIPCQHFSQQPLTEKELDLILRSLPIEMPKAIQDMLQVVNGAELFCIEQADGWGEANQLPRIKLLNGFEILRHHIEHMLTYLTFIEDTPEMKDLPWKLNYLAFADALDGNFLAINLEDKSVFFLDHEYAYYPIGYESQDPGWQYIRLADSLESWMRLVNSTQGKKGLNAG